MRHPEKKISRTCFDYKKPARRAIRFVSLSTKIGKHYFSFNIKEHISKKRVAQTNYAHTTVYLRLVPVAVYI